MTNLNEIKNKYEEMMHKFDEFEKKIQKFNEEVEELLDYQRQEMRFYLKTVKAVFDECAPEMQHLPMHESLSQLIVLKQNEPKIDPLEMIRIKDTINNFLNGFMEEQWFRRKPAVKVFNKEYPRLCDLE